MRAALASSLLAGGEPSTMGGVVQDATTQTNSAADHQVHPGWWVVVIAVGGSLAGLLLATLLFRVCMGLVAAVILTIVTPVAIVFWQGNPPTISAVTDSQAVALEALGAGESDPRADLMRRQREALRRGSNPATPDPLTIPGSADAATDTDANADNNAQTDASDPLQVMEAIGLLVDVQQFRDDLWGVWSQQGRQIREWWTDLPGKQKRFLAAGAGLGGVVGLILGLALPHLMASLQSALVGAVLMFFSGRTLLLQYYPSAETVMPQTWRAVLLTVGLITLLGVLIQWTLRRRKSDE